MGLFGRKDDPKSIWEHFFKVVLKYDWDKALELLEELKKLEPQNAQVYIKLAEVLQRKGDKPSAVAAYHRAARFLVDMVNMQKALAVYKMILRLSPDDTQAQERAREIMHELGLVPAGPPAVSDPQTERPPRSIEEAINAHPVFSALEAEEIADLEEKANRLRFDPGQEVIRENDTGDSVFIISSGTARVTTTMFGQSYELAVLGNGDFFGEIGFLSGMPRTATVTAASPLEVIEIDRDLMNAMVDANPVVLERMAETSRMRTQDTLGKIQGEQE
jgi:tetratricopeptide (TPR) repeat protein